jgi:hypothetical protein
MPTSWGDKSGLAWRSGLGQGGLALPRQVLLAPPGKLKGKVLCTQLLDRGLQTHLTGLVGGNLAFQPAQGTLWVGSCPMEQSFQPLHDLSSWMGSGPHPHL